MQSPTSILIARCTSVRALRQQALYQEAIPFRSSQEQSRSATLVDRMDRVQAFAGKELFCNRLRPSLEVCFPLLLSFATGSLCIHICLLESLFGFIFRSTLSLKLFPTPVSLFLLCMFSL